MRDERHILFLTGACDVSSVVLFMSRLFFSRALLHHLTFGSLFFCRDKHSLPSPIDLVTALSFEICHCFDCEKISLLIVMELLLCFVSAFCTHMVVPKQFARVLFFCVFGMYQNCSFYVWCPLNGVLSVGAVLVWVEGCKIEHTLLKIFTTF